MADEIVRKDYGTDYVAAIQECAAGVPMAEMKRLDSVRQSLESELESIQRFIEQQPQSSVDASNLLNAAREVVKPSADNRTMAFLRLAIIGRESFVDQMERCDLIKRRLKEIERKLMIGPRCSVVARRVDCQNSVEQFIVASGDNWSQVNSILDKRQSAPVI